jgi:hypothetical protein
MTAPAREPDWKHAVDGLAERFDAPVDVVAELYERERAELARSARVTNYLHIFTARMVEDALRKGGRRTPTTPAEAPTLSAG